MRIRFYDGLAGQGCADASGIPSELLTNAATDEGVKLGVMALGPIPVLQKTGANFVEGLPERLSAQSGTKVSEQDLRTIMRAVRHQSLFSAPGIDIGFFADLSSDSREIGFQ